MILLPRNDNRWRERGQTVVLFAVFLIALLLLTGLAIDFGRVYLTRARLSKAVDAACLNAARSYSPTDGGALAQQVATSAFNANYGSGGPAITVASTPDPNNAANTLLNCNATTTSNTLLLGILPGLSTVNVPAYAQTRRATLVMTIVLDRSGSMSSDGGWTAATGCASGGGHCNAANGAIPKFITYFDNARDYIGLVSYANNASTDVPLTGNPGGFCTPTCATGPFQTKLAGLIPTGATFTLGGITNATYNNQVPSPPGNVFRVIVLLTDGLANVTQAPTLGCVNPNYSPINFGGYDPPATQVGFYYPVDGSTLCTIADNGTPACVPGGGCTATTFLRHDWGLQVPFTRANVSADAKALTLTAADQLRSASTTVFTIGVGNNIDPLFLQQIANDPASSAYNPGQPVGAFFAIPSCTSNNAQCNADVLQAFEVIAANVLLRLTQ